MKTAQVAAMRDTADEFERLAALAPNRATKNGLADLAIHWHLKAGQTANSTSEDIEMHGTGLF
jgi:hypothetical protein